MAGQAGMLVAELRAELAESQRGLRGELGESMRGLRDQARAAAGRPARRAGPRRPGRA